MAQQRLLLAAAVLTLVGAGSCHAFQIEEATIDTIHAGFNNGSLTSAALVRFYLDRISRLNPYVLSADPCGSSTGSAIAAAANLAAVTLGTETDGSILCPASLNSVVGIKPTLGLTSRAGVIPISPRQDTVG
jgi:Asp-tRNA(Asn)/Glu-tRNA(Gln) amidotransferase A subunit family amidase